MLPPEKVPLGYRLPDGRAVLEVDLPVVAWDLEQRVLLVDLIHEPLHFAPARFEIFAPVIDFDSIRTVYCFKRAEVHCDSFLRPAAAEQRRSRSRPLHLPCAEDQVFGWLRRARPATLLELFLLSGRDDQ